MTRHSPPIPLSASQRFRDPIPIPGLSGYGVWAESVWDNNGTPQHCVDLTPTRAPWRELFAAFDELGRTLPADPVGPVDEAEPLV